MPNSFHKFRSKNKDGVFSILSKSPTFANAMFILRVIYNSIFSILFFSNKSCQKKSFPKNYCRVTSTALPSSCFNRLWAQRRTIKEYQKMKKVSNAEVLQGKAKAITSSGAVSVVSQKNPNLKYEVPSLCPNQRSLRCNNW